MPKHVDKFPNMEFIFSNRIHVEVHVSAVARSGFFSSSKRFVTSSSGYCNVIYSGLLSESSQGAQQNRRQEL